VWVSLLNITMKLIKLSDGKYYISKKKDNSRSYIFKGRYQKLGNLAISFPEKYLSLPKELKHKNLMFKLVIQDETEN